MNARSRPRRGMLLVECLCYMAILGTALGILQSILIQRFGDARRALNTDRRMGMRIALERRLREDIAQTCGAVEAGGALGLESGNGRWVRWNVDGGQLVREVMEADESDVERLPWLVERLETTVTAGGLVELRLACALNLDLDEPVIEIALVEATGGSR